MITSTTTTKATEVQVGQTDFVHRIEATHQKCLYAGSSFVIFLVQIGNLSSLKGDSAHVANQFLRDLFKIVRQSVHSGQYVGVFRDGLGLVFESVELGHLDVMKNNLLKLAVHAIRSGQYDRQVPSWGQIVSQFLWPKKTVLMAPWVGWSIGPRDGNTAAALIKRALQHIAEQQR